MLGNVVPQPSTFTVWDSGFSGESCDPLRDPEVHQVWDGGQEDLICPHVNMVHF